MSKTYILQQDLPYVKAGVEYQQDENGNYYCSDVEFRGSIKGDTLHKDIVENNHPWFKRKEDSPIKVTNLLSTKNSNSFTVYLSEPVDSILPEKFEDVKRAIEDALNSVSFNFDLYKGVTRENFFMSMPDDISRNADGTATKVKSEYKHPSIWLTKEKLDSMMGNVWLEARATHPLLGMKHKSFSDYKDSLPENKNS